MGKLVTFGNLKGGSTKSTTTATISNWLNWNTDLNVLIIDADDTQVSLKDQRDEDLQNEELMRLLDEKGKEPYEIHAVLSSDVNAEMLQTAKDAFDVVFLDLPGNVKQKGVIPIYALSDMVLIPVKPENFDMKSTKRFADIFRDEVFTVRERMGRNHQEVYTYITMVTRTEENRLLLEQEMLFGFPKLRHFLPFNRKTFGRMLNTLVLAEYTGNERMAAEVDHFCQEVYEKIKNLD